MCLAIPMQIVEIDGYIARCAAKGALREVSLLLMQGEPLEIGDFIVVHTGYAHHKVSAEDAHAAWELFDELLAASPGGDEHLMNPVSGAALPVSDK